MTKQKEVSVTYNRKGADNYSPQTLVNSPQEQTTLKNTGKISIKQFGIEITKMTRNMYMCPNQKYTIKTYYNKYFKNQLFSNKINISKIFKK